MRHTHQDSPPDRSARGSAAIGDALRVGVCAFVLLAAPTAPRASGSVHVEVVGVRCTVGLEQLFRRTLRARSAGAYYRRVREGFYARLGRVLPAVERQLGAQRSGSLTRFDLRYPRRPCASSGDCATALRGPYPQLLLLSFRRANDRMHQWTVGLPLRRAPTSKALAKLRRQLQAIVDRLGGTDASTPSAPAVEVPTITKRSARMRVRIQTSRKALRAALPGLAAQNAALLRTVEQQLQKKLAAASKRGDLRVGRWRAKAKVSPYRIGKPLPALLSLYGGNEVTRISAEVVLTALRDDRARSAFDRDVGATLTRLAGSASDR